MGLSSWRQGTEGSPEFSSERLRKLRGTWAPNYPPKAQHPNLEVSGCGKWPLCLGEAALEACSSSLKNQTGGSAEEGAFAVSLPLEPRNWCQSVRVEAKSETWI